MCHRPGYRHPYAKVDSIIKQFILSAVVDNMSTKVNLKYSISPNCSSTYRASPIFRVKAPVTGELEVLFFSRLQRQPIQTATTSQLWQMCDDDRAFVIRIMNHTNPMNNHSCVSDMNVAVSSLLSSRFLAKHRSRSCERSHRLHT